MAVLMGYEAELYYGTAGSTAGTELTIARDVRWTMSPDMVEINSRASFTNSNKPAGITHEISFDVLVQDSNAFLATCRANIAAGTAMAFKIVSKGSGTTVVDADFYISSFENGQPLRDKQTYAIGLTATEETRTVTVA